MDENQEIVKGENVRKPYGIGMLLFLVFFGVYLLTMVPYKGIQGQVLYGQRGTIFSPPYLSRNIIIDYARLFFEVVVGAIFIEGLFILFFLISRRRKMKS